MKKNTADKPIVKIRKDWLFVNFIGIGLTLNIVNWIWIGVNLPESSGKEIPLHYLAEFGVDFWGDPAKLFILPGIGIVILVINLFLAFIIWRQERLLARILAAGAGIAQIILLVSVILITKI